MKVVSPFEQSLIQILRCILGNESLNSIQTLLVKEVPRPNCLGRDCVEIIENDLSKGVVQQLCRWSWTTETYWQIPAQSDETGSVVSGRLWERTTQADRQLSFSAHTMDWLIWLTSINYTQPAWMPGHPKPDKPLLLGDRLFLLLMFETLQNSLGAPVVMKHPALRQDGLIWLLFVDKFASINGQYRGDFAYWMNRDKLWIVEALQQKLAKRWEQIELLKRSIIDPRQMHRLGRHQQLILNAYLSSIESCKRRDLSRFMLLASQQLLQKTSVAQGCYSSLDVSELKMSERDRTHQSAVAFWNQFETLRQWQQSAVGTSFYDEDYHTAQFWKLEWERLGGDQACDLAQQIVKQFDLLNPASL